MNPASEKVLQAFPPPSQYLFLADDKYEPARNGDVPLGNE